MSIIAVHGFPMKFSLADAVKKLARPINGNFEALNFLTPKGQGSIKSKILRTCYIRLSDKLDPVRVVEQINSYEFATKLQYKAYIPDVVPDLPLSKPKRLPLKIRSALNITDDETHDQVLLFATQEILLELQIKYPGLYSLSKKYQHKLLQNLSKKLYSRVKELADGSSELDSCMKMTRAYRRAYPHFGDFQLVLDMHHEVQDGAGVPRTHLQEADIAATPPTPLALDMPLQKLRPLRNKCTERVLTKMTDHIKSLDAEINPTDDEEKIARKQVRQELKKLLPFLPTIVNQMMDKHLMPQDGPMCRVRIYGEPYLPNKDVLGPFLSKYKPVHVMRSTRMYNLIKFSVPPALYHQLTAMNGTVLNGAKLVIRSSDMAEFKGVSTALGLTSQQNEAQEEEEDVEDEAMEEDQEVNWDEEL